MAGHSLGSLTASRSLLIVSLAMTVASYACAGRAAGNPGSGDSNLITRAQIDEMEAAGARDLYEVVARLRPIWLRVRTGRSINLETVILVYHDNTRLGDVNVLRGYPLLTIKEIRHLDSAQAGVLPGTGSVHVDGVIVITSAIRDAAAELQRR